MRHPLRTWRCAAASRCSPTCSLRSQPRVRLSGSSRPALLVRLGSQVNSARSYDDGQMGLQAERWTGVGGSSVVAVVSFTTPLFSFLQLRTRSCTHARQGEHTFVLGPSDRCRVWLFVAQCRAYLRMPSALAQATAAPAHLCECSVSLAGFARRRRLCLCLAFVFGRHVVEQFQRPAMPRSDERTLTLAKSSL